MKCWVCGNQFGGIDGAASDCPGICLKEECLKIVEDEPRWEEFVKVKEAFVIAKLKDAGAGQLYVYLRPRNPEGK